VKAVVIAIGNELTNGQSLDTNSAWLSEQLGAVGVEVIEHRTVPDTQPLIVSALRECTAAADLVVVTGGLGPTPDDLTRHALAEVMGATLIPDDSSMETIEAFFRKRGREMNPINRVQALIPAGAEVLANPVGTAPGIRAELGRTTVYVLPGVPHEMKTMYTHQVVPRLSSRQQTIVHEIVRLFGAGESDVAARISDLMLRDGPLVVGTTVTAGLISVRITSTAQSHEAAQSQMIPLIQEIHGRLGSLVLGVGNDVTVQSVLGEGLRNLGQSLATAESCTGGLLGALLTEVPGSSEYYLGGVVAYHNGIKQTMLHVGEDVLAEYGAVSEPVAGAMARGVREVFGADWGIGITGVAGPSGGTAEKPVGTVCFALSGPDGTEVRREIFPGDRYRVRHRAALSAMNLLRLKLGRVCGTWQ
jgi:nicotinamide-nucleotide amidase